MNFLNKLFGKKKQMRVYITDKRTPEQEEMLQEQRIIMDALGMEHGNAPQNWLRLHQILLDDDARLKKLEFRDADNE
jgi:hypothetical protein